MKKVRGFHLALEAGDLKDTLPFYTDVLGRELGEFEEGKWQDIDFWGHELTLHQSPDYKPVRDRHDVDMGAVCVPHFGAHLSRVDFDALKKSIEEKWKYFDKPYVRFKGQVTEQETFFVEDPVGNVLEFKTFEANNK